MIRGFSPDETHRLDDLFKDDKKLQKIISDQFSSMVPLLLLNLRSLGHLHGIRAPRGRKILDRLENLGLEPARSNESLRQTLDRQYGCVEDAPVQALSTLEHVSATGKRHTVHEPLDVIGLIHEHNPLLSVGDVAAMTKHDLLDTLIGIDMPMSIGELELWIDDLEERLVAHGLRFSDDVYPVSPVARIS